MRRMNDAPKNKPVHQGPDQEADQEGEQDGQGITHPVHHLQREKDKGADHDAFAVRKIEDGCRLDEDGHPNGNHRVTASDYESSKQYLRQQINFPLFTSSAVPASNAFKEFLANVSATPGFP